MTRFLRRTDVFRNNVNQVANIQYPAPDLYRPEIRFLRDAVMRLVQREQFITNVERSTFDYVLDDLNRVVVTQLPAAQLAAARGELKHQYEVGGALRFLTDPLNEVTEWVTDTLGRATSVIEPSTAQHAAPQLDSVYGITGNVISTTEAAGSSLARTTSTQLDNFGNVLQTSYPTVNGVTPTTSATYDILGNMISSTDVEGNTTHFVYDDSNRLTYVSSPREDNSVPADVQILDQSGATTSGTWTSDTSGGYNDDHLYVDYDAAAGADWRFTVAAGTSYMVMASWHVGDENSTDALFSIYDGAAFEETVAVDQTTAPADRFEDGHDWRVLGVYTVSSGGTDNLRVSLAGDANARVVADAVRIMEVGPTVRRVYNGFGEVIAETDPLGNTTTYEYDLAGRQTKVTLPDPDGAGPLPAPVITRAYDTFGNLLSETDPLGNTTSHTYDAMMQRRSTTDANLDTTYFDYNLIGQLVSVTDPIGNVTLFHYDNLGRQTAEEIIVGGVSQLRSFEYDLAGNLTREIDRNGRVRDYVNDELGRPVTETWYDTVADANLGTNAQNVINHGFDVLGRVTAESDLQSSYSFTFDALDRTVSTTAQHFTDIGDVTLTSDYTRLDNLRDSLTATIAGLDDFVNTYAYDDLKRLTSVTQSAASPLALVAEKRVDFGWRPDNLPDAVTRYADLAGTQLVAASSFSYDEQSRLTGITHSQDATVLATYDLAFDAASRLTTFTTLADGVVDYTYDDRGQLIDADYADPIFTDETYAFDGNGNRTNTGFALDPYNRYTSDGVYTYQYDAEGNRTLRTEITTGATVEYVWDHSNRLAQIIDRDSAGDVTQKVTYTYDLYDRRIAKMIDDGVTVTSERYVYDGEHIALQFDENGLLTNRYLHGPAVDQILADEQLTLGAVGEVLWPLTDHLGSVRDLAEYDVLTDVTDIANHITYGAFGEITSETDAAVDHLFGYTGRETDEESDLTFYRARYYDPAIGQFISEDPIGFEAGDANTRRYVGNSPTTSTDPTGLNEEDLLQRMLQRDAQNRSRITANARRAGQVAISPEIESLETISFMPGEKQTVADHVAFMIDQLNRRMTILERRAGQLKERALVADYYRNRSHDSSGNPIEPITRYARITAAENALMDYRVEMAFLGAQRSAFTTLRHRFKLPKAQTLTPMGGTNAKAWVIFPAKFIATVGASVIPGIGELADADTVLDARSSFVDKMFATGSLALSAVTLGAAVNYGATRVASTGVSKQLGDNLAGGVWAGDAMRHLGFDAHHVVPWDSNRAKSIREFMFANGFTLDEIKYGDFNGVWLPGPKRKGGKNAGVRELWPRDTWHRGALRHSSKHSKDTMEGIRLRLLPLQGDKQAIMDEIREIGIEMQNGVFRNK